MSSCQRYPQSTLRLPLASLLVAAVVGGAPAVLACPFCASMGKTLAENVAEAGLVAFGTLSEAKLFPDAAVGEPDGSTRLVIKRVIKSHPAIAGKREIRLPRYIPAAESEAVDYVLFAELVEGRIDPYRGLPVDSVEFVEYLAGAVAMAQAETVKRLGYFFSYLDHEDPNISGDAYKEFSAAPYKDVLKAAKTYDSKRLIAWLRDKDTPSYRIGLYGCMLGTCGGPQDAQVLRQFIEDPSMRPLTGVDGLMGGYCVLEPQRGPEYVLGALVDPDNDFNFRYAALRTVRFLLDEMPQLDRARLFSKMSEAVEIPDIADLIIDELRKNRQWTPLARILALYGQEKFDLQVVRRAIIRFAIKCPDAKAKAFIEDLRRADPQLLADVEEILRFEEAQKDPPGSGS